MSHGPFQRSKPFKCRIHSALKQVTRNGSPILNKSTRDPSDCIAMSASASDGTHSQEESAAPLNVSQHTDDSPRGRNSVSRGSRGSAQDRPTARRGSIYQVAAQKSRSSQHEKKESKKQEPANNGESVTDPRPKFDIGWQRAALGYFEENLLEQKMWIQCTLKGAKQRGEDWIDSRFIDEKHSNSGCSACLYANLAPFIQQTSFCNIFVQAGHRHRK